MTLPYEVPHVKQLYAAALPRTYLWVLTFRWQHLRMGNVFYLKAFLLGFLQLQSKQC
jgi:hypothetical protein